MVRINYNKVNQDLKVLESTLATPLITGILAVLTIFYASSISDRLPPMIRELVNNIFVRIGFVGAVMALQMSNPSAALGLVAGTFAALLLSYIFSPTPIPKVDPATLEEITRLENQHVEESSDANSENAKQLKAELEALIKARDQKASMSSVSSEDATSTGPCAMSMLTGLIETLQNGGEENDGTWTRAYNTALKNVDVDLSLLNPTFRSESLQPQAHNATLGADTRPSLEPLVLKGARARWAEKLNPRFESFTCPADNSTNNKNSGNNKNTANNNSGANGNDEKKNILEQILNSNKKDNSGQKSVTFTSNDLALQQGGSLYNCVAPSCGLKPIGMTTHSKQEYCRDDCVTAMDNIIQNNVSILINLLIAEIKIKLDLNQPEIRKQVCGVLTVILNNCNKTLKEFFNDPDARAAFMSLLTMVSTPPHDSQALEIIYDILRMVSSEMKNLIAEKLDSAITLRQGKISEKLQQACDTQVDLNNICNFTSSPYAPRAPPPSAPRMPTISLPVPTPEPESRPVIVNTTTK